MVDQASIEARVQPTKTSPRYTSLISG